MVLNVTRQQPKRRISPSCSWTRLRAVHVCKGFQAIGRVPVIVHITAPRKAMAPTQKEMGFSIDLTSKALSSKTDPTPQKSKRQGFCDFATQEGLGLPS
jgi:hypothetical protein